MRRLLPVLAASLIGTSSHACSCFGNSSYCETLSPDWWDNPDATALVVKLSDVHYGITVKVLQTFDGSSLPNDTLTVWGDNGALCRNYLNGFAVGDTLVFGLDATDFMGNTIWNSDFPPDLEQEGDYMLSGCGVHLLDYVNGAITGPINGPANEYLTAAEFEGSIASCSGGTGVDDREVDPLVVRYVDGAPVLEFPGCAGTADLRVFDAQGRLLISRSWNGRPITLDDAVTGMHIAEVRYAGSRWSRKLIVLER